MCFEIPSVFLKYLSTRILSVQYVTIKEIKVIKYNIGRPLEYVIVTNIVDKT